MKCVKQLTRCTLEPTNVGREQYMNNSLGRINGGCRPKTLGWYLEHFGVHTLCAWQSGVWQSVAASSYCMLICVHYKRTLSARPTTAAMAYSAQVSNCIAEFDIFNFNLLAALQRFVVAQLKLICKFVQLTLLLLPRLTSVQLIKGKSNYNNNDCILLLIYWFSYMQWNLECSAQIVFSTKEKPDREHNCGEHELYNKFYI